MTESIISWVDHDQTARQQTYQLMASFGDSDSRDELGIGTIRDSISDFLFPGTSTIQTRLRYILLVPWIYDHLESNRFKASQFGAKAEEFERSLIKPLISADDSAGAFGKTSKEQVKRLPSSVYWSALSVWGIRKIDRSQDQYHRQIGQIYRLLDSHKSILSRNISQGDSIDDQSIQTVMTWDAELPSPPKGFPDVLDGLNFKLSGEEARYLREKLMVTNENHNINHSGLSLLGELVKKPIPLDDEYPWGSKVASAASNINGELLEHARIFSTLIHGAHLLYNLMVAEKSKEDHLSENTDVSKWDELIDHYQEELVKWHKNLPISDISNWSTSRFWEIIRHPGHNISTVIPFVESWRSIVLENELRVDQSTSARELIKKRELRTKPVSKSRLHNKDSRSRWGGKSATNRLSYRWSNVKVLLKDLYTGLGYGT